MKIYFPLIQTELLMDCRMRMPFGIVEKYICRCIEEGIQTKEEIQSVLELHEDELNEAVSTLTKERMIKEKEGILSLLYDVHTEWKNFKYLAYQRRYVIWCYNGLLNAEQKIKTRSHFSPRAVKIDKVLEDKGTYYFLPKVLLHFNLDELKALKPKMLLYKGMEEEDIIEIVNLKVIKEHTIFYEPYELEINNNKVLLSKIEDSTKVNHSIGSTLQKLYDQGKLPRSMHKVE